MKKSKPYFYFRGFGVVVFVLLLWQGVYAFESQEIDPNLVQKKIAVLGLRDDTLQYQESPEIWLKDRRDYILSALIAGLDNPERRIAAGCLKATKGVADNQALYDALIRIAADKNHPINKEGTLQLCTFALTAQAKAVLQQALDDTTRFSDFREQATIALALGLDEKAVECYGHFLSQKDDDSDKINVVQKLGTIGHPSAEELLKTISQQSAWRLAVESYFALFQIDPTRYPLSDDQKAFLKASIWRSKANHSDYVAKWTEMAGLNREQVRPFAMQMLASDSPEPALVFLQIWKDKAVLPHIRSQLNDEKTKKSRFSTPFVVAYLDIEGTDQSVDEVLSMLETHYSQEVRQANPSLPKYEGYESERVIQAVVQSQMSANRKLEVLRQFRDEIGIDAVVSNMWPDMPDFDVIVRALISEESSLGGIGLYVKSMVKDKEKQYSREISAAMTALAAAETLSSPRDIEGAIQILNACAEHQLADSGKQTDKYLSADNPAPLRIAAARVSAQLGGNRKEAMGVLYQQLTNPDGLVRQQAAMAIIAIGCRDKTEQMDRELFLLSFLGKPEEKNILRILPGCSGQKTAEMLLPILDQEDVSRAVCAAWVLAQHPDEAVKEKGIRRLAIFAMFNHNIYQQGAGIDFQISADVSFHQTTESMMSETSVRQYNQMLPPKYLVPFEMDAAEQAFSIRAYRSMFWESDIPHVHPTELLRYGPGQSYNESYLPLLRTIAAEDPYLSMIYVQGKPIAHFTYRQKAAEQIAKITGKKETYKDIKGDDIDSGQTPGQPYDNQNHLIAAYVLDQIKSVLLDWQSGTDKEYRVRNALEQWIHRLVEICGQDLKDAILAESEQRAMAETLKKANFSLWRK